MPSAYQLTLNSFYLMIVAFICKIKWSWYKLPLLIVFLIRQSKILICCKTHLLKCVSGTRQDNQYAYLMSFFIFSTYYVWYDVYVIPCLWAIPQTYFLQSLTFKTIPCYLGCFLHPFTIKCSMHCTLWDIWGLTKWVYLLGGSLFYIW